MSPASSMHARWLVRKVCAQHVEETPLNETAHEEIARAIRSCATLNASLGQRVNPIFMREVIRLFEELHEVYSGNHPEIRQNAALTINNVPKMIEDIQAQINDAITELLAHTEPFAREKVPA